MLFNRGRPAISAPVIRKGGEVVQLQGKKQALIGASAESWIYGSLVFGLFGILSPMWQDMFNASAATTGALMTLALFTMGAFNYLAGKISDKKGSKFTITIGITLAAISIFGFSIAKNMFILFPAGLLLGASGAMVFGPGLTCVQKWWPPEKAGMVSGIYNLCFGIAAAIMVPIYRGLLSNLGYSTALLIIAAGILVLGLFFSLFTASPMQSLGAHPKGIPSGMPSFSVKEATSSTSFKLLWLIWGLAGTAGIGLVMHVVKLATTQGFTVAQGAMLLIFFNLFNGLIRIVVGPLADKVKPQLLMWPVFALGGIACLFLTSISNFNLYIVALSIIGMTTGIVFTVIPVLVRKYFGIRNYGAIFGLVFTSYCFFSAFFGPFVGGLISKTSYMPATIMFGIFLILAAILAIVVKPPQQQGFTSRPIQANDGISDKSPGCDIK